MSRDLKITVVSLKRERDGRVLVKGMRIFIMAILGIFIIIPAAAAADLEQSARLQLTGLWGETSVETTFRDGRSRLVWPMDVQLAGVAYTAGYRDIVELEVSLHACPWIRSGAPMKDYDWLDESYSPGLPPHGGTDIYSESKVDSKAFMFDSILRVYPLSVSSASAGLFAAYHNGQADFRAYDTNQIGFGPWQGYTNTSSGPTCTYNLKSALFQIGLTGRLHAGNVLKITIDASVIPYAEFSDEDNHIRRSRVSRAECSGYGGMLSISTQFALGGKWYLYSSCSKAHVSADGHQNQYWYGNDPASPGNETGHTESGINTEITQDSFRAGIAIGCRL